MLRSLTDDRLDGVFGDAEWAVIAGVAALTACAVLGFYQYALNAGLSAIYACSAALAALVFSSAAIGGALSRLRTPTAAVLCAGTILSALVLLQTRDIATLLHLTPLRMGRRNRGHGWSGNLRLAHARHQTGPQSVAPELNAVTGPLD